MTDFATDDLLPLATTNVGSLSHGGVFFYAQAEPCPQAKIVSYKKCPLSSALAHLVEKEISENENLSTLYAGIVASADASMNCVQWTPLEGYDLKNIFISSSGRVPNFFWPNEQFRSTDEPIPGFESRFLTFSEEVIDFCYKYSLLHQLQVALRLAANSFSNLKNINIVVEHDPEVDDEWLTITIQVSGEVGEVLDMYDDYAGKVIDSIPWPVREKIRLIYDIV